jgi:hypothetical protein
MLSVAATTAVAAQASMEIEYDSGGSHLLTTKEKFAATFGAGKLKVPNWALNIECTKGVATGEVKNVTGGAEGNVNATAIGCSILNDAFCTIYPSEGSLLTKTRKGEIDASGSVKIALSGGSLFVKASSGAGIFTTIWIAQDPGCTLPEETEVSGTASVKITNGTTHVVNHSLVDASAAEESALGDALSFAAEPAVLEAGSSTDLHLTGAHSGQTFWLN